MAVTKSRRTKSDSVAVASRGRVTSQINFQENSDKSETKSTAEEDKSETTSTTEDKPRIKSTKA